MWDEIVGSKDPTVFTVFLEDSAGLAGTFLAFLGIFLGRMLHNPYFDPIASIVIGVLLTRGYSVGARKQKLESAIARLETHIRQKEPTIKKMFLEPDSLNRLDEHSPHDDHQ
jgi:divalent metal cation (Fe/Co/Zn/Cd) transporter